MIYNLYSTTDGGTTETLEVENINTGYQFPYVGTVDLFVKAVNAIGTSEDSNIEEGTALPGLSISWNTQTDNVLFNFEGIAGSSMEFTNDGGATWNVMTSGSPQTITTAAGPYEIRERLGGGVTHVWFADGPLVIYGGTDTSKNITGTLTATGGNLTSGLEMFYHVSVANPINVSGLNTSGMTTMKSMFARASAITTLDLSNFDTSLVTDTTLMFATCANLVNQNIGGFNTTNLTNMSSMFLNCQSLTDALLPDGPNNINDVSGLFRNCINLEHADITNFDMSGINHMDNMFQECAKLVCLTNIDTSQGATTVDMFTDCPLLVQPDAAAIVDLTDIDGANWINPGTCP